MTDTNTTAGPAVYNHDIVGFVSRTQRFQKELIGSSSAGVSEMSSFDLNRLLTYIKAMTLYQKCIQKMPACDYPETNKDQWDVKPLIGVVDVENESIMDLQRKMHLICKEMLSSQSARMSSRLMPADDQRLTDYITNLSSLVTDYIDVAEPLDQPESSPDVPMTPQGKTGV